MVMKRTKYESGEMKKLQNGQFIVRYLIGMNMMQKNKFIRIAIYIQVYPFDLRIIYNIAMLTDHDKLLHGNYLYSV